MNRTYTNKDIKIGDVFCASWGYEQTNADFFRVKEKRGKTQLIIQEVSLHRTDSNYYCDMGGDFKYDANNYKIIDNTIFINNNEEGKIVKVKSFDGKTPYFTIGNGYICRPYKGEAITETWYC